MTIKNRLKQLEETLKRHHENPYLAYSTSELVEELEKIIDLQPHCLSRTPEEAYSKGYDSMADEIAQALGMTAKEFKAFLELHT